MDPVLLTLLGTAGISALFKAMAKSKQGKTVSGYSPTPTQQTPIKQAQPTQQPQPTPTTDYLEGFIRKGSGAQYYDLIKQSAQKYNIHPALLAALLFQESGIQPEAKNVGETGTDRGMAQINSRWNPDVTDEQAYDPNFAIPWAAKTLSGNIAHFGDINRGVAAYNVGRGGASIKGPQPYGGGPKGQAYLDAMTRNLDPELKRQLGLITSY
jgi:soluble lytic murein transglycosylase-like protein